MASWCKLVVLVAAGATAGCSYGYTQNPVSFPHWPKFGDIVRTHSKPAGESYFANYDRDADHMEVTIQCPTAPVGSRQIVLVSILDAKGQPLRRRCVEWTLEGAGSFLEVDESGLKPGRGYKVDSRHAVTYTDLFAHTLKKNNGRPEEDVALKPGSTWAVISSMTEGDSHLSIWAPEIANWDENRRTVTIRWVDAEWTLPPIQAATRGGQPVLTTLVRRRTDRAPLSGYRVRYRILDGAPAVFAATNGPEAVVASDDRGAASVAVRPGGQGGRTRVGVQIIRPADPSTPSGTVVVVGEGETAIDWEAPVLSLEQVAPASVGVGQDMTVSLLVVNKGNVAAGPVVVRVPIPDGAQYVNSEPAAKPAEGFVYWELPGVEAKGQVGLRAVLRGQRVGTLTTLVSLESKDGAKDERSAKVQVLPPEEAKLVVSIAGPTEALLNAADRATAPGSPVQLDVTIRNVGTGVARNVLMEAGLDDVLRHDSGKAQLTTTIDAIAPGESKALPLDLRPIKVGAGRVLVVATADGKPTAPVEHVVNVREGGVGVKILGPQTAMLGKPATWEIEVVNGPVALQNAVLQARLPAEVDPAGVSQGGQLTGREAAWSFGPLPPNATRRVQVTGVSQRPTDKALVEARVTGQPGDAQLVSGRGQSVEVYTSAAVPVVGLPALKLQVLDRVDPVAVGDPVEYRIVVTNEGTSPVGKVQVTARLPDQVTFVSARGPTTHQQAERSLTFGPIDQLQPGQAATYFIDATAARAGDARLQVQLLGGGTREGLVREESTNIR